MPRESSACIFCEIVAGRAAASVVYADDRCLCFMGIQPTAPGECMVIPREHVDHFTDVGEDLAAHLMRMGHRVGRQLRKAFPCERVGFVVHGYGVPHAHLLIVPQHGPHHIASDRFARVDEGEVVFDARDIPFPSRKTLDEHAHRLRSVCHVG